MSANPTEALERSQFRMSKEAFELVFNLTKEQPWLKTKQGSLIGIIDSCENEEEQVLVCDLLRRFTYLDGDAFSSAVKLIADHIVDQLGLESSRSLISARENSDYADSSQLVTYQLKGAEKLGGDWTTNRFISRLRDAEGKDIDHVILVDEFIGTGETMEKSVNYLKKKQAEWDMSFAIHVAVVAGMDSGLQRVTGVADSVFAVHTLTKGISDFYPEADVPLRIQNMTRMEQTLAEESRRGKLSKHSLGYKKSEALYSRIDGNTPNNVFPIFWWEIDVNGQDRERLLICR